MIDLTFMVKMPGLIIINKQIWNPKSRTRRREDKRLKNYKLLIIDTRKAKLMFSPGHYCLVLPLRGLVT